MDYKIRQNQINVSLYNKNNGTSMSGYMVISPNLIIFTNKKGEGDTNCFELWEQTLNIYKAEKYISSSRTISIIVTLKNFRSHHFLVNSSETECDRAVEDLKNIAFPARFDPFPTLYARRHPQDIDPDYTFFDPLKEYSRMGAVDMNFVLSNVNKEYNICPSYSERILLPKGDLELIIKKACLFRAGKRFPIINYYHKATDSLIITCGQPKVGPTNRRSPYDEYLFALFCLPNDKNLHSKLITVMEEYSSRQEDSGNSSTPTFSPPPSHSSSVNPNAASNSLSNFFSQKYPTQNKSGYNPGNGSPTLSSTGSSLSPVANVKVADSRYYIFDTRIAKFASRAAQAGGGHEGLVVNSPFQLQKLSESFDGYCGGKVEFLGCPSTVVLKDSFDKLHNLVSEDCSYSNWLSKLESSEWMTYIQTVFKGVDAIKSQIGKKKSCVIHGEDGTDWAIVLSSLSQLLLDPYYRTFEGFICLIEKDWFSGGHRFSERLSHFGENKNDSPIFPFFLDCVFQLMNLYPTAFAFNEYFLIKLFDHANASPFGTFFFNNNRQRQQFYQARGHLANLWVKLLRNEKEDYRNRSFIETAKILDPPIYPQALRFWSNNYARWQHPKDFPPVTGRTPWNAISEFERKLMEKQKQYSKLHDELTTPSDPDHTIQATLIQKYENTKTKLEKEDQIRNNIIKELLPDFPDIEELIKKEMKGPKRKASLARGRRSPARKSLTDQDKPSVPSTKAQSSPSLAPQQHLLPTATATSRKVSSPLPTTTTSSYVTPNATKKPVQAQPVSAMSKFDQDLQNLKLN